MNRLSGTARRILTDTSQLSTARVLALALTLTRVFVLARLLGPDSFGEYNLLNLIILYGSLANPGFRDMVHREIPYFRGQGKEERIQGLKDTAFTGELGIRLLVALGVFAGAFLFEDNILRYGLMSVALVLVTVKLSELYQTLAITDRRFSLVSRAALVSALGASVFVFASVYWFGVYSGILAPAVAAVVVILYYRRELRLDFHIRIDRKEALRLLRPGLGLTLLGVTTHLFRRAGVTVVALSLGITTLGIYGLAAFIIQFGTQVSGDLVTAIKPRLYERLGRSSLPSAVHNLIAKPSWALAYSMALAVGLTWVATPLVIGTLLPAYGAAEPVMSILVVSLFFTAISVMPYTLLYAPGINKQVQSAVVWVVAGAMTFGLGFLFVEFGWGIKGVAVATVAANAVAAIAFLAMAQRYYITDGKQAARFYASLALPLAYVSLVFLGLEQLPTDELSLGIETVLHATIMVLAYIPCLLYLEKQTSLPSETFQWARGLLRRRTQAKK